MNDLKFYPFKQRLMMKAKAIGKKVFLVNKANTSKTCSNCGNIYRVEKSKIYDYPSYHKKVDRDMNTARNILMKGLVLNSLSL